jgi:DmsE family decaheme c-type cytochrome
MASDTAPATSAPRAATASAVSEHGNADTAKPKAASAKADGDYVGNDTCVTCHEDQHRRFKNTVMGRIFAKPRNALEGRGCEACHGPGKAHVEAGGGKETIPVRFGKDSPQSAEEKNAACLQCHRRGQRLFWTGSPHETRGMSCVDCHQVMGEHTASVSAEGRFQAPLGETRELKRTQPELCLQCHQMRRAQLQRSSHMPFREGKVTCTNCHNPHGSPNPKQLIQSSVNENCYSCHAERRGPFLWEHPPVLENCSNCHEAHGSTNPQLLKMRQPRLCQQCHDNSSSHAGQPMPVLGSNSQRVINRGCTNCHMQVHGSNHPSGVRFQR